MPSVTLRRWKRTVWFLIGTTTLFASIAAIVALARLRDGPAELRPVRLLMAPPEGARYASWNLIESAPAVSPDGREIAFVAHRIGEPDSVWLQPLDGLTASPLPGTQNASSHSAPFWSPNSRSLGLFAEGKLKRIDVNGGPPQTLADAPDGRGGTCARQDHRDR